MAHPLTVHRLELGFTADMVLHLHVPVEHTRSSFRLTEFQNHQKAGQMPRAPLVDRLVSLSTTPVSPRVVRGFVAVGLSRLGFIGCFTSFSIDVFFLISFALFIIVLSVLDNLLGFLVLVAFLSPPAPTNVVRIRIVL